MKKLRMIVTSVIVLAIVGSAFAFNSKKLLAFCIDTDTTTGTTSQCNQVLTGQQIVTSGGSIRYYFNGWDGNTSSCINAISCPTTSTVRLAGLDS